MALYDEYFKKLKQGMKPSVLKILNAIKDKHGITSEIVEHTGYTKTLVYATVTELKRLGLIYPTVGSTRNGSRYHLTEYGKIFTGSYPEMLDIPDASLLRKNKVDPDTVITPKELLAMLRQWSTERWEPKINRTANYLPMGISKLYQLAFDSTVGSEITAEDLRDIQYYMGEFRQSLEHTKKIMDRVMHTPELWNTQKFAAFLLSADIKPEAANSLAIKMAEINRQK